MSQIVRKNEGPVVVKCVDRPPVLLHHMISFYSCAFACIICARVNKGLRIVSWSLYIKEKSFTKIEPRWHLKATSASEGATIHLLTSWPGEFNSLSHGSPGEGLADKQKETNPGIFPFLLLCHASATFIATSGREENEAMSLINEVPEYLLLRSIVRTTPCLIFNGAWLWILVSAGCSFRPCTCFIEASVS